MLDYVLGRAAIYNSLSLSLTHIHIPTLPGLLYIQNGDSLTDLTGFNNLLYVNTLVLALLGTGMTDLAGFSSLYNASRLYITRNSVSQFSVHYKIRQGPPGASGPLQHQYRLLQQLLCVPTNVIM